jgi:hypothetical protein
LSEFKTRHNTTSTFVPAEIVRRPPTSTLQPIEVQNLLPMAAQTGHARQDDSALTHAKATLLISTAYIVAAAMVTVGLLLVVWLFRGLGDGWATYTYTGLIVWGIATLWALWGNRKQSLWHSPTGISHHEIDSRERLAKHAIDTHAKLLLKRWDLDNE